MKKYNGLLLLIVLFCVTELRTSAESFSDRCTDNIFVKSAEFYAVSSLVLGGVGKALQTCSGASSFTNTSLDFDALYNDTFPKNYSPKSVVQKVTAHLSRGCLIAGSVCSAPLRSIVSVTYNSIETLGEEMAFKRHVDNLKREARLSLEQLMDLETFPNVSMMRIAKQTAKQMARGSLYGVLGFGVPYVYQKYMHTKIA